MPENNFLKIEVTGIDKLTANMDKLSKEITGGWEAAGQEAGKEVIDTIGLRKYPPETAANQPPPPYYKRGSGTQFYSRNLGNSEKYGTQFYVESVFGKTTIGNHASYAKFLSGEKQAKAMGRIGWRKLWDVANEKRTQITEIYQKWINRTIKKLGL